MIARLQRDSWYGAGPAALSLLLGLGAASPALAGPGSVSGEALLRRFECHRCHEGTGLPAAPRDKHCVRCHREILAGTFPVAKEHLTRWQSHLSSLNAVPSLTAVGKRLRWGFIADFLLAPHDLRPNLPATMPRLQITPKEAQALASHLVPAESTQPAPAVETSKVAAGRVLLDTLGCGTCHLFTGAPPLKPSPIPVAMSAEEQTEGLRLAPDLRHTRSRFQPGALVPWLLRPRAVKPDTPMPAIPLNEEQAQNIAAYILTVPLQPAPVPPIPERLPVLTRRVGFDEVNERVFRRTCWHCHSAPEYALGDGGPGNTGGFGFRPRGLSLADYVDISSGSLDDQGRRRSVFLPLPDGTPRLLMHLLARQREVAGQIVPGVRGMPLGLPPLTPEQIQLVESWITQGRPR